MIATTPPRNDAPPVLTPGHTYASVTDKVSVVAPASVAHSRAAAMRALPTPVRRW